MASTLIDIALNYASKGIAVFPVIPGSKKPACAWGDEATTDPAMIARWWKKNPRYNIGIAAAKSGLVIVDLDDKGAKNGSKEWSRIARGQDVDTLEVATPSGGRHLYFRGELAESGTDKLAPGVDIKSGGGECGGYVLGIGSEIDGRRYKVANKAEIAPTPAWLKPYLTKPRQRQNVELKADVELDTPAAMRRAREYLHSEEPAIEGAGGDQHTYNVANNVLDCGVSIGVALELMCEEWNENCSPPWDADDLLAKLRNAARYRSLPVGISSIEADFEGLEVETEEPKRPDYFRGVRRRHPASLPRRPWILGTQLQRKIVTVILADPGQGKTSLSLAMALAVCTGRDDIVEDEVVEPCNVMLLNNEDGEDELDLRLAALMEAHEVTWDDIDGKFFPWSAVGRERFTVAKRKGAALVGTVPDWFIEKLRQHKIGVLIVDPLVETHQGDENDNVQMATVAAQYRDIAVKANCAVVIVHHTNKPPMSSEGFAANMYRSRGASSLIANARIVDILCPMSEKDAERFGKADRDRWQFSRLDRVKGNMGPRGGKERWFKSLGVILANEESVGAFLPEKMEEVGDVTADDLAGALIPLLEQQLRVPLADAAEFIKCDGWFDGTEKSTVMKQLESYFGSKAEYRGWQIWIESAVKGKRREKFLTGERIG